MTDSPRYPIATLIDISRIPPDAMPRFLEEFPLIVASARANREAIEAIYASAGLPPLTQAGWVEATQGYAWIDDDKGTVSAGITLRRDDGTEHRLVSVNGSHKTGKFSAEIDIPGEPA